MIVKEKEVNGGFIPDYDPYPMEIANCNENDLALEIASVPHLITSRCLQRIL